MGFMTGIVIGVIIGFGAGMLLAFWAAYRERDAELGEVLRRLEANTARMEQITGSRVLMATASGSRFTYPESHRN